MKYLILALLTFMSTSGEHKLLFDFNTESSLSEWRVVDDVVMGGVSSGNIIISDEGHGMFSGNVSLDNNGGFSSIRYRMNPISVEDYTKLILRLKGDEKSYQVRVKNSTSDMQSYINTFSTSGEWEKISVTLNNLYPSFRGRKLEMPNFNHNNISEISILIANKRNEEFKLMIDKIWLE
ncbi:MAG: CIA30 family protein [Candidatus Kapaibacteriales bacterium]